MSAHPQIGAHRWLAIALVVALIAGHGVMLRYAVPRFGWSALVVGAIAMVVVIKTLLFVAHRVLARRRER